MKAHKNDKIVIKMDIGGAEVRTVRTIFQKINVKEYQLFFTVCTYHNPNDYADLLALFSENGFCVEESKGYMLFGNPPSFKKAIMRACR